jgi:pilus assembly protein FimV
MSVSSVGSTSLPDPAFYGYTPSVPTGLAYGDPAAPGSGSGASSSSGTASSSGSSASGSGASSAAPGSSAAVSPYVAEYATLQQQDAAELLQVSLGTPAAAQSNIASVLAQAAALQSQQIAAQQQAAAAAAQTDSAASAPDPLSAIPSFESIVGQSDQDAASAMNGSGTGSNVDTLA